METVYYHLDDEIGTTVGYHEIFLTKGAARLELNIKKLAPDQRQASMKRWPRMEELA